MKSFTKCEITNDIIGAEDMLYLQKVKSSDNYSNDYVCDSSGDFRGLYNKKKICPYCHFVKYT